MAGLADAPVIAWAASHWGISAQVLWGVYGAESNYGHDLSTSSAGAQGYFQFIPSTARQYGVDVYSLSSSAYGAAHYLHDLDINNNPLRALNSWSGGGGGTYYQDVVDHMASWPAGTKPSAGGFFSDVTGGLGQAPPDHNHDWHGKVRESGRRLGVHGSEAARVHSGFAGPMRHAPHIR